jgi:phosphonate transport system permease protein
MTRAGKKRLAGALLILVLLLAAAWATDCSPGLLWARRGHLTDLTSAMFPPEWGYAARLAAPLWDTLQMSVAGTGLGALLALFAAPLCAACLRAPGPVRYALRAVIQILRSFPALILALIATFLFGLGTFAGTAALTVYTFAIMTRLTYEDIEAAPMGAYHALCAMGTPFVPAYFRAVLPSILPSYLTNVLYLLETNVRHSAILGYVGAGGIGLLLNEKMSWLEYGKVGMILFSLFLTTCVIETVSGMLARLVQGEKKLPKTGKRALILLGTGLFVLCCCTTAPPDFSHTSAQMVQNLFSGLLHPDWRFFFDPGAGGLMQLLLETVCIAFVGTCAGTVLAVPLAFLSAGRLIPKPIAALFRLVIMAIRSVPFLIYGLIFIRAAGPGPFTGVLTLAVCSVGLLSKRFIEAVNALDFRAYHALAAMGVSPLLRVRYGILPQLWPMLASAVLYRFDVNLREAAVLGLVGAGGIGAPLIFAMNQYAWDTAAAICLGLILLVWAVDGFSGKLRAKLQ